jgi:Zn-dependent peptidase ImmA (M78 family)
MGVRRKFIRDVAEKVLDEHCPNGAPVNVQKVAEKLGIVVKFENVDDDLSGFLFRDSDSGHTIIGVNKSHHRNRQNFTIAHELGHFLLHEAERVHLDSRKSGYALQLRSPESATGENINEREANLFAAELLMPAKFLEKDLRSRTLDLLGDKDEDALKELAKRYKVSVQALTIRLDNLGYINHES